MWVLIFFLWPFVELYLLIKFAVWYGFLSLLGQIGLTALIGFIILQIAQSSVVDNLKNIVFHKTLPAKQMADDLLLCLSGGLLMLPGIISDVLGITLLIPIMRKISVEFLYRKFKSKSKTNIIEGEFHEVAGKHLP